LFYCDRGNQSIALRHVEFGRFHPVEKQIPASEPFWNLNGDAFANYAQNSFTLTLDQSANFQYSFVSLPFHAFSDPHVLNSSITRISFLLTLRSSLYPVLSETNDIAEGISVNFAVPSNQCETPTFSNSALQELI
jgi:hypothetical protein